MADHNPPYLFELDGNKDPEELFEVGALQQAVHCSQAHTRDNYYDNFKVLITALILL